jgi:hypothetical protein
VSAGGVDGLPPPSPHAAIENPITATRAAIPNNFIVFFIEKLLVFGIKAVFFAIYPIVENDRLISLYVEQKQKIKSMLVNNVNQICSIINEQY